MPRFQLAALAVAALLASACAGMSGGILAPEVHVVEVAPLESTLFEQRVRVDLRIRNPNDFPLECDGLDFDLVVNGSPLARGFLGDAFQVPRLGEQLVSVTASTTARELVRQLFALGSRQSFEYELDGRIHLTAPRQGTLRFSRFGEPLR